MSSQRFVFSLLYMLYLYVETHVQCKHKYLFEWVVNNCYIYKWFRRMSPWSLRPLIPAKFSRLCDSDYLRCSQRRVVCDASIPLLLGFQENEWSGDYAFVHWNQIGKCPISICCSNSIIDKLKCDLLENRVLWGIAWNGVVNVVNMGWLNAIERV